MNIFLNGLQKVKGSNDSSVFAGAVLMAFFFVCLVSEKLYALTPNAVPPLVSINGRVAAAPVEQGVESMGVVFEKEGFVLTSFKNLTNPRTGALFPVIDVSLWENGKSYRAEIVGVEPTINLGILKIFANEELRAATTITHESMQPGDVVWAPSPDYFSSVESVPATEKVTVGRIIGMSSRECYQESLTSTMLKAELRLDQHPLGAPLFNRNGQVFALHTGYKATAKVGHKEADDETHVLPIKLALNIYESLKHRNSMQSPWTGFSILKLNAEQKRQFPTKHGDRGGVAIEYVWENSPAEKLGIKSGDILVRFGHYRIEEPADFQKWLYMYGVDHEVKMMLIRDGEYQVHQYLIEERPKWAVPK